MLKAIALAAVIAVGQGGALSAPPSPAPHPVDQGTGASHTSQQSVEKDPSIFVKVGRWAAAHHDAIEALSAAGTFAFTVALVASTIMLWRVTRRAADAATDAAGAATTSVASLSVVERAYLFITISDIVDQPPFWATANIGVENYGKTPAILKRVWYSTADKEPTAAVPTYDVAAWEINTDMVISATGRQHCKDELFQNTQPVFIIAFIEYEDIFNKARESRTCLRFVANPPRFEIAGPPAWNAWT